MYERGAAEPWRQSVGPIVWKIKYLRNQKNNIKPDTSVLPYGALFLVLVYLLVFSLMYSTYHKNYKFHILVYCSTLHTYRISI